MTITQPSSTYTTFITGQIRIAGIRARLIVNEIDAIDVALRAAVIGPDDAISWLHAARALGLIAGSSAITQTSSI